jgi:hypothetical protein
MGRVLRDMRDHSLGRDRREISIVHQGLAKINLDHRSMWSHLSEIRGSAGIIMTCHVDLGCQHVMGLTCVNLRLVTCNWSVSRVWALLANLTIIPLF